MGRRNYIRDDSLLDDEAFIEDLDSALDIADRRDLAIALWIAGAMAVAFLVWLFT